MKRITYDIEWDLERSHWWFVGRRKLLKLLLAPLAIQENFPVIDIGCGVGSNLGLFRSMGYRTIGVDAEIYSLELAKKSLPEAMFINGDLFNLPVKSGSIGLIVATDILEHLDDDTIGIREIHRTLVDGGKAIITVPAFKSLLGVQDIVGMHRRRYGRREFEKKMEAGGLTIMRSSYFNSILFFPIFLARRLIRLLGLRVASENRINFPLLNFFLKAIFSLEPHVLKYFSFPFGVSIFCIVKK
jgi:SAM-dependent methyltransferase